MRRPRAIRSGRAPAATIITSSSNNSSTTRPRLEPRPRRRQRQGRRRRSALVLRHPQPHRQLPRVLACLLPPWRHRAPFITTRHCYRHAISRRWVMAMCPHMGMWGTLPHMAACVILGLQIACYLSQQLLHNSSTRRASSAVRRSHSSTKATLTFRP